MNVPAKTEYACIALLELALQYGSGQPVRVRAIAETHGIPARFLVQILLQLKGAGFVTSTRGVSGGYQLLRDPHAITLGDVRDVIEGRPSEPAFSATRATPVSRVLLAVWRQMAAQERQLLEATTLADLAGRIREPAGAMYYI